MTIIGPEDLANLGASVAVGDFDADGFDDVAMGAPELIATTFENGDTFVLYGSPVLPALIEARTPPRPSGGRA